jgi:DNA-binding GntR family transcriptional regulator
MEKNFDSAAQAVAASLRELIANGGLLDGARLVERDLADQFSVSRVPMREAIQRLAQEGLVEIHKNRGAVVKSLTKNDVEEIYGLRILLEGDAMFRSVGQLDDKILTQAELVHSRLGEATVAQQQGNLNRDFHRTLYTGCGNSRQIQAIGALHSQIERHERIQHRLLADTKFFQQEHAAILDACRKRDAHLARALTISHLESARDFALKLVGDQGLHGNHSMPSTDPTGQGFIR